MASLQDRILAVFIDKRTRILKDTDITNALVNQGIPCTNEDIRRHVQSLSPALFQVIFNDDRTTTIRVEPKIEICEDFLGNRCKAEAKSCEKLHMCRHIDSVCTTPNCRFPHDFSKGINRKILAQHQCQHINPVTLVKFLRIKPFSSRPQRTRGGRGRNRPGRGRGRGRASFGPQATSRTTMQKDDPDQQVDVSFPSSNRANQVDMEIIRMILNLRGINVESIFNENENEYCQRATLQLETLKDVEELLQSPIIQHHDIDIKFKRTKQIIDKTNFILKTSIKNEQDKIDLLRFNLYATTLVGNNLLDTIIDLSSDTEQIMLVQCKSEIDFNKVRQGNQLKPKLQEKDITLIQIYECDALEIRFNNENELMSENSLKNICRTTWQNIFAYNFPTENSAEIEFINTNACQQWRSTIGPIERRFNVTIAPIINELDDNNDDSRSTISAESDTRSRQTKIELRQDWAVIAGHPKFKIEYKDFIRNQFGGEIDIHDDTAIYNGPFPNHVHDSRDEIIFLGNKTNEFMKKFECRTFANLDQHQIDILRANSANVAYSYVNEKDYIVATRVHEMQDFKRKLFAKTNQPFQPQETNPSFRPQQNNQPLRAQRMNQPLRAQRMNHPPRPEQTNQLPQPHPMYRTANQPRQTYRLKNQISEPEQTYRSETPPANNNYSSLPVTTASAASTSMYSVISPDQLIMFTIDKFEDRLREYLHETYNVKAIYERNNTTNEKVKGVKTTIRIKIIGQTDDVENAMFDLQNLFSSLRTKKFDEKTDGSWTKIEEATQVIQHHFNLSDYICICQQTSPTTVSVYHFDITNPQFGIDEQKIDNLIKNQFRTATIPFKQQSKSSNFTKDWTDLENNIHQRNDYKKNICLYNDSNMIYLFGLIDLVKEFRKNFEQLQHKYDPQPCKITLSERQLNYLAYVGKSDMNKMEKQYKSEGCDISLARLRQHCEFLAPIHLHSKIKDNLEALAQIRETSFDINEPGFEILIGKEQERLLSIVKNKCYLEKKIDTYSDPIPIPNARVVDLEDTVKQTHTASALPNVTSVNIGHSTINIALGDLTGQTVDAIVACSSSEVLCQAIVSKAGPQVQKEYAALRATDQFPNTTSGGTLKCKRIIFVPWTPTSRNEVDVKTSLSAFITFAFENAILEGCKSIAFPAIGCGQLNFDPFIIAKYMLRETQNQLKLNKIKMNISFILLNNQQNVYDAFIKCLNDMETIDLSVNQKTSATIKKDDQSTILYDRKIIKITLISSNENHLITCKEDIFKLARSFSIKSQINKPDMLDWSQNTIYTYYDYCLKQRVIPTLDLSTTTLELVGPKDAVHEAEKYFYELTSETFKKARIHAVSQGVIWSVELGGNNSDTWEQYSYKLNGIIEDASFKKHSHVDFENDKEEKCRIIFSIMEEHCGTRIRRVRRKLIDSILPKTWEPSDQNCKRVTLQSSSQEYQNVLAQFNLTMIGKYSSIIKIERIQNERWYKQYAAHRDDFQRRYTEINERSLFHGCPSTSADQIIKECFNRSFAGVNGVVYGCGVYFHAQASYSHQYAHKNNAGERTMFLARVLIGKTCKGNDKMKVVPPGYDTTTDGQHIYVVYHDAGAYADHLITYK